MSELNKFNRESLSVTSAMPFTGGAKKSSRKGSKKSSKRGSKKGSKKGSMKRQEMCGGAKKSSKKSSKKGSKKGSRKQKRGMPQFMVDLMQIKKAVKAKHTDIKDGPALSSVGSQYLKSTGNVKDAIEAMNEMSTSALQAKLDKVKEAMDKKRQLKKASKQ